MLPKMVAPWGTCKARHLMERFRIDADPAFSYLRRISQDTNRKLVDLAAELVATGRLPGDTRHDDASRRQLSDPLARCSDNPPGGGTRASDSTSAGMAAPRCVGPRRPRW